jgi:hypothetical protein
VDDTSDLGITGEDESNRDAAQKIGDERGGPEDGGDQSGHCEYAAANGGVDAICRGTLGPMMR